MTTQTLLTSSSRMTLQLDPVIELDNDQLFELCGRNRDLRIERTATGELILMSPAGGKTADRNAEIITQLRLWAKHDGAGRSFDSSGGFTLPSGAMRSPDAAWVEKTRLRSLSEEQREKFLPLCPTFVIELRSPSDTLSSVQDKMTEYLDHGALLGWLIDPTRRRVHIYRPDVEVQVLEHPSSVAGDPELPGFVLDLGEVWNPDW